MSSNSTHTSRPRSPSRRDFLAKASAMTAGLSFAPYTLAALQKPVANLARPSETAAMYLPDPISASTLRAFATAAIDAARAAGASYADIRIADTPGMAATVFSDGLLPAMGAWGTFRFGIRVIVDGASAFVSGNRPNIDIVTAAARNAVASARGLNGRLALRTEVAPAPVVTGEWETPLAVDPFTIPLQEHWDVLGGYLAMVQRVKYGQTQKSQVVWSQETRVFASTEGSMITQRFHHAGFELDIGANVSMGVGLPLPSIPLRASGGFELATDPAVHEQIIRQTEECVRLAMFPAGTMDVGRYDLVVSGATMANLMSQTIAPALELDRALGHEAGASGTSYLAPPLEILGTQAFSPLVNVISRRDGTVVERTRWDDEGIECTPTPLIDKGRVVDFLTSRTTVGTLRPWYERNGRPTRSNGNAHVDEAWDTPLPRVGHVSMLGGTGGDSLDTLCRDIKHGILVYSAAIAADQQFASVFGKIFSGFEIKNGRITCNIQGSAMQATTKRLWNKSLKFLGSDKTIEHVKTFSTKSQPVQWCIGTASAPAGIFTDVDIVNTGAR